MKLALIFVGGGFLVFVTAFVWAVTRRPSYADEFVEMTDDRRRSLIFAGREQAVRMGGF